MADNLLTRLKENLTGQETIIGKDKYFNSAVLIPIININNEYHLLFEKRAKKIRQGGEVSFPGGEFDGKVDENFKQTAVRETEEELGIGVQNINVIGKLGTLVAPMGVTVDAYVAELNVKNFNELNIDTNEVERIFSIPVSHFINNKPSKYFVKLKAYPFEKNSDGEVIKSFPAEKFNLPPRYSGPWEGGTHRILVYETNEETIWGITAELVFEFCKLLQ
jgi:8-oxo-dGTP pyrophosphatase MutT (NUDIX family)